VSKLHLPAPPTTAAIDLRPDPFDGLCLPTTFATTQCYCQPIPRFPSDLTGPNSRFVLDNTTGTTTVTCLACGQPVNTSTFLSTSSTKPSRQNPELSPRSARRKAAAAEATALLGHLPEFQRFQAQAMARSGRRERHHSRYRVQHLPDRMMKSASPPSTAVIRRAGSEGQLSPRSARRAIAAHELIENTGMTPASSQSRTRLFHAVETPTASYPDIPTSPHNETPRWKKWRRNSTDGVCGPELFEECFPSSWLDALQTVQIGRWRDMDDQELATVIGALKLKRKDAKLGNLGW